MMIRSMPKKKMYDYAFLSFTVSSPFTLLLVLRSCVSLREYYMIENLVEVYEKVWNLSVYEKDAITLKK